MLYFCFFIIQKYFPLPFHIYWDIYHVCFPPLSFIAQQIILHFLTHSVYIIFRPLPFCNDCSKPLPGGLRTQLSHYWNSSVVRNIFRIKTKSTTACKFIKGRVSYSSISHSASKTHLRSCRVFPLGILELSVQKCDSFHRGIYIDISMISIWCHSPLCKTDFLMVHIKISCLSFPNLI